MSMAIYLFLLFVTEVDAQTLRFKELTGTRYVLEKWLYVETDFRN